MSDYNGDAISETEWAGMEREQMSKPVDAIARIAALRRAGDSSRLRNIAEWLERQKVNFRQDAVVDLRAIADRIDGAKLEGNPR